MPKQQPYSRKLSMLSSGSWLTAERAKFYPIAFLVANTLIFLAFVLAGKPIGTDFASFWTASRFVLAGNAAGAYDPYQHHAAQILLFGKRDVDFYAWFYPPTAFLIVAPLGLLPYGLSLFSWLAVTAAAYVWTVWRFIPRVDALIPILGFPAVFTNVGHGQNAFLSTAIVGLGLFISDRRPIAAGVLLGCLCYKPQLAPMLVIVVLARRDWKMALGAALSIVALSVMATLLFGPEIWISFKSSLLLAKASLEQGIVGFGKMQSAFSAIRLLGGGNSLAYCAQAAVAVTAAILLWQIWRTQASLLLRTGATGAAILLGTPFILDYDFVLLALPIAALTSEGLRTGFRPYEKSVLAVAWVLPLPWVARFAATYANIPLSPEIILLLLVLIWKRASADDAACVVGGPETGWNRANHTDR
jgi:alpha-1,2-mannosyltransferase